MTDDLDFDPTNARFLEYAEETGVLYKAGVVGSRRYRFTMDHAATESEFLADPYFNHAASGYFYTKREMESQWMVMHIAKRSLQKCWMRYTEGL